MDTSGPSEASDALSLEYSQDGDEAIAHQRKVSFDATVKAPSPVPLHRKTSVGEVKEIPNDDKEDNDTKSIDGTGRNSIRSTSSRHSRTLTEVLRQQPVESEVETRLLAALEETNLPTDWHETILPHIAPDATESLVEDKPLPRPSLHRRQRTMEQHLDGLTDALGAIHHDQDPTTNDDDEPPILEIPIQQGMSSKLDEVANAVLRRRKKSDADDLQHSLSTEEVQDNALDSIYEESERDVESGRDTGLSHLHRKKPSRCRRILAYIPIVREFMAFFATRKASFLSYVALVCTIAVPSLLVAGLLFYVAGNPPTGRVDLEASRLNGTLVNDRGEQISRSDVSASWWLLFLGVRQVVTLSLAQVTQFLIIDFLCVGRIWTSKIFGPVVTLLIVQSRGWPMVVFWWSIYNLAMNHGVNEVGSILLVCSVESQFVLVC